MMTPTEAAAPPLISFRATQATGPPLRPQGCFASRFARRPAAALDPGDLYGPWADHSAGRPNRPAAPARGALPRPQDPTIEVSTVSGDCQSSHTAASAHHSPDDHDNPPT